MKINDLAEAQKTKPKQSQNKPNQTQFAGCSSEPNFFFNKVL